MKEDHLSCLFKDTLIKLFQNRNQTLTNWNVSCFSLSITRLAFSACRHLSHHYFFYFVLSLHRRIRTPHVSSKFLPCRFLISGKLTAWHFKSLIIPGDKTKKLREVMAAYLLYRCKHLCMLRFCVVSPSLTENSTLHNQSDNMISVM